MASPLAAGVVFGYLAIALILGVVAGRQGKGDVNDFVAGERAFGPVVMYFVMGATIFSAFALLGTPQRVVSKGSDVFYIFAYGAVGFVPLFFFGPKVRRIGAREGYVTQAELVGRRFESPRVTAMMGAATLMAFLPYMVIQLKGAGIVMEAVTGWPRELGAGVVYAVVITYVILGGVRGVGWTNVLQGIAMLVIVWGLGLGLVFALYGGLGTLFDRVAQTHPEHLTLPGPGQVSHYKYSSEVLVSILGFTMWPHTFMKAFTARSSRLVQLSVVLYPTFLVFLLPLVFLGYIAVVEGGPADDSVLFWLAELPLRDGADGPLTALAGAGVLSALVAFAVLAASMSTGDALLHAGGSILVRDVLVGGLGYELDDRAQTRAMRLTIIALGVAGLGLLATVGNTSVVDLLLLAYAIPIQFLPLVLLGLYWRRANRRAAELGLAVGLGTVLALFLLEQSAPALYGAINPLDLELGVMGLIPNALAMVVLSVSSAPQDAAHLAKFEL